MLVEVLIDSPFVPGEGAFGLLRFSFTLKISPFLFQFYLERTRSQSVFFIGKQTTLKFTTPVKALPLQWPRVLVLMCPWFVDQVNLV